MTKNPVTFGYVLQTVPRGYSEEVMADPMLATRALLASLEEGISLAYPHFDTIWIEDHLQWGNNRPVLEALSTLSYLAGRNPGPRFGTIVLCQSFRNPALVAKIAALLHACTDGRFILGIGAGWKEDEYLAHGYPFPSAGQRVAQLEEAVLVLRAMWSGSPATFEGKYYSIKEVECQPLPHPPIPILIGGGGEAKTLRVVARHADWWTAPVQSIDEYRHKQSVLAEHCKALGRDPGEIVHTFCARVELVSRAGDLKPRPGRYIIGGTPDMVLEELSTLAALGVRHFQLSFLDFPGHDQLRWFCEAVAARLTR
jgi:alkanesulfonate monooxygenase SsuD/methylene tetrahydromethanopterin reductase-like flavin-dependent oxidoreductase (luciferase family)